MAKIPKMHLYDDSRDGPACGTDRRYADTTAEREHVTCAKCQTKMAPKYMDRPVSTWRRDIDAYVRKLEAANKRIRELTDELARTKQQLTEAQEKLAGLESETFLSGVQQ